MLTIDHIDTASEFIYLGSKQANSSVECVRCISLATGVMNERRHQSLSVYIKFCLFFTLWLWDMDAQYYMWAKVQAFHVQCQHRILSIKWNKWIPNVTVGATSGLDITNIASVCRLGLFSHVARFHSDIPASNVLNICCLHWPCIWIRTSPNLPRCSQVDNIEPPDLITSLPTPACLWVIYSLWHKIVHSGRQSPRSPGLCTSDWQEITPC